MKTPFALMRIGADAKLIRRAVKQMAQDMKAKKIIKFQVQEPQTIPAASNGVESQDAQPSGAQSPPTALP